MTTRRALVLLATLAAGAALAFLLADPAGVPSPSRAIAGTTSGSRAAPRTPPRLAARPADLPRIQADPGASDYDPLILILNGVRPQKLFAAEPRDPTWAPQMESRAGELLRKDMAEILPSSQVTGLECRKMSCRLQFEAPEEETVKQINRFIQAVPLGDSVGAEGIKKVSRPDGSTVWTYAAIVSFRPVQRNITDHERLYVERRRQRLEFWRSKGGYPELVALPKE